MCRESAVGQGWRKCRLLESNIRVVSSFIGKKNIQNDKKEQAHTPRPHLAPLQILALNSAPANALPTSGREVSPAPFWGCQVGHNDLCEELQASVAAVIREVG